MSLSINDRPLVRRVKEGHFAKLAKVTVGKVVVGWLSFRRFLSVSFFIYKSFEIRRQHVSRDASAINAFRYWNMILFYRRTRCVSTSERRKRCFEFVRSRVRTQPFSKKNQVTKVCANFFALKETPWYSRRKSLAFLYERTLLVRRLEETRRYRKVIDRKAKRDKTD